MLRNYLVLMVVLISCGVHAMDWVRKSPPKSDVARTMFRVSSVILTTAPVKPEHLQEIMPVEECKPFGQISTLLIREQVEWFRKTQELHILKPGVREFRSNSQDLDEFDVRAVTLIRTDVSDALGGAHRSGDHIHVDGIDLSEATLPDGAMIAIKADINASEIKALLLKTYVPHLADWKFENRCGALAYRFFNDMGEYHDKGAIARRLRGVVLAVLQEGKINPGDYVQILSAHERDRIMQKMELQARVAKLLELSKPLADTVKTEHEQERAKAFDTCDKNLDESTTSTLLVASGVLMSFVLIFMSCSV